MHVNDIKNLVESKGYTKEHLLGIWFEVYVLNKEKKDVHAEFAQRLDVTRNEAKILSYFIVHQSPYLQNLLRGVRESVLAGVLRDFEDDNYDYDVLYQKYFKQYQHQGTKSKHYYEKYQIIPNKD